jgi:protein ImuA
MTTDLQPFAASHAARIAEWRPGLTADAVPHGEIFASGHEGAGAALALALALDRMGACAASGPSADAPNERTWMWVQDRTALRLTGRPCRSGLPRSLRRGLVHVAAKSPGDALFALEEGLRCRELAFIIGEIAGDPRALDFTASRRLSLAVEKHGVPLWLVRLDAARNLSSARMRWQVRSAASPPPRWNPQAPGMPSWRAELFRARNHPPGEWILRDDGHVLAAQRSAAAPDPGDLVQAAGDRPLAAS